MSEVDLRLDWCSYEAAKFAVEHWHYSRSMSASRRNVAGVWECGVFIGAVVFSRGAVTNIGNPYGLNQFQCCELTRVALSDHKSAVSRIVSIAIKMLKRKCPDLRLIVSYADMARDHHGGIYQAMNWVYVGKTAVSKDYFVWGEWVHQRTASSRIRFVTGYPSRPSSAKHKYLYPLDPAIRKQVAPLAHPYPKRASEVTPVDTAGDQLAEGAAAATRTLLP